jgi:hypothetical protein
MAYDARRQRVVLFGGRGAAGLLSDTWEWDGTSWLPVQTTRSPGPRAGHAMAYDSARGRLLLVGGTDGTWRLPDTWELYPACSVLGPGHPGGGPALACWGPPRIGTLFCVGFANPGRQGYLAFAPPPAASPPIPFPSRGLCAPGLLYLVPWIVVPLAGDPALLCVPLPDHAGLYGQAFVLQGAALDPAGCFRLTEGLLVTIQS